MAASDLIRQHKRMAMGQDADGDETFGCDPIESKPHPDRKGVSHRQTNQDYGRGAATPIPRSDGHGAQANPDHGPHGY